MKPIRLFAAALIASGGLAASSGALAAPKGDPTGAWAGNVILVGQWDRDGNRHDWRDRDHDRRADRQRDGDRRADRQRDRDRDRDRRADRRDDRDWDRRAHRRDRDHRRGQYRDERHDRGHHYGWDRGRHYGWGDDRHRRYKAKHWRTRHHPRHRYWVGRRLPRVEYVVIERYDDYYLPPPRRGHYYVRYGSDVYLIAEATHRIIDAFVLLDAVGR